MAMGGGKSKYITGASYSDDNFNEAGAHARQMNRAVEDFAKAAASDITGMRKSSGGDFVKYRSNDDSDNVYQAYISVHNASRDNYEFSYQVRIQASLPDARVATTKEAREYKQLSDNSEKNFKTLEEAHSYLKKTVSKLNGYTIREYNKFRGY